MRASLAPSVVPWRRPRHELVLLVLVAAASLSIVYPPGAEDISRMCLTHALVNGRLSADECLNGTEDRSSYGGHLYSNTAPGLSVLAVPVAQIVRFRAPSEWKRGGDLGLWAVRLSVSGFALIVCAFLVGRVAEGLAPGWGGATLVTFSLGTIASAAGPSSFGHVAATALAFGAFVLAWSRRSALAGLAGGLALLTEYQSGLILVVVGAYVLATGIHAALRYTLGVLPGALVLGAYNWAAFGSPFHLSYRYGTNEWADETARGFFGIQLPSLHGIHLVLAGNRGLLVVSPVVAVAAYGLFLLWRRGRGAEVAVCVAVTLAFLALDCGYFLPYGGDSPGPRFLIPALPFLALGVAPAFDARPVLTAVLAAMSLVASTSIALTWPAAVNSATGYRWTVWRELADVVRNGSGAQITTWAQKSVLSWVGVGRLGSAAIVLGLGAVALAIAVWSGWTSRKAPPRLVT